MKNVFTIIGIFLSLSANARDGVNDKNGNHGNERSISKPKNNPHQGPRRQITQTLPAKENFPSYPKKNTPPIRHFDSIGNKVTHDHMSRVDFANHRSEDSMKNNERITGVVQQGRTHFVNHYRPDFEKRTVIVNNYISNYNRIIVERPLVIERWRHHHFYGGFYYGFHPILNIDAYFYNPMVYWFYVPTYQEYYYRTWYHDSDYDTYPSLHYPFAYHGLYYPTENLKQLLFGVSGMTVDRQVQFRAAITIFTKNLAQELADSSGKHVRMSNGDIVLTHYEVLGYDQAIQVDGFVTENGIESNFKGILDLQNPAKSSAVVITSLEKDPTPQQIK
jgi:hypothetical protein